MGVLLSLASAALLMTGARLHGQPAGPHPAHEHDVVRALAIGGATDRLSAEFAIPLTSIKTLEFDIWASRSTRGVGSPGAGAADGREAANSPE